MKELDFIPLVEILAGDDIQQKRGAIEQLTRLRTKEAVRILMSHRSDPSMEMRFYANASLVRIKREFDEALDAARQQMQMDSDNVMSRLNLAKIYVRMAESGLLDPDLAASHENEAIFHLGCVMDSESPTREAAQTLIVLQMRRRDWTRAEKSIQHAFGLCLISDDEAAEYRAEILYSCGQFAKIKTALQPISADASLSAEWRSTLLWWGLRS